MRLDRLDADAQVIGDLFIQATGHDAFQHLGFAQRQFGQQGVAAGGKLVVGKRALGMLQHALHQAYKLVFLERFLDEIHRTLLHRVDRHRHVAVAGDEDDGQRRVVFDQAVLQLQAGHAAHADVDNQAGYLARVVAAQERLGRIETAYPVVLALQQPLQ